MPLRGLVTTVGYHRYFSHRSFKTSRALQFALACLCCTNLQRGPLWWAAVHRHHHRHSDCPDDAHSPVRGGFLWAYCGWMFATLEEPDLVRSLGIPQPQVSKHLLVLREVGAVEVRHDGRRRVYRLNGAALKPIHDWVSNY